MSNVLRLIWLIGIRDRRDFPMPGRDANFKKYGGTEQDKHPVVLFVPQWKNQYRMENDNCWMKTIVRLSDNEYLSTIFFVLVERTIDLLLDLFLAAVKG